MKKTFVIFLLTVYIISYTANAQTYPPSCVVVIKQGKKHSKDQDYKYKRESKKKDNLYRNLAFDVTFDASCQYDLTDYPEYDAGEQRYFQKVMKLCTNQSFEDQNSIRLGWYWDPTLQKIVLGLYAHINHQGDNDPGREFLLLEKTTGTNLAVHVIMVCAKKGMYVRAGEKAIWISRNVFSWSPNNDPDDANDEGNEKTL